MPQAPNFAMGKGQGSVIPATPDVPINPTPEQLQARTDVVTPKTPAYSSVSSTQQKQPAQEPAVVSSSTISDKVIPQNNTTYDKLSDKGSYVDGSGTMRHADGSLMPAPLNAESGDNGQWSADGKTYGAAPQFVTGDDPESQKINDLFAGLKQSLDASTKKQVDVIEQNHSLLVGAQQSANESTAGALRTSLLNAGGKFTPMDMGGRMLNETSMGLQRIAALDAQENSQLAAASKAQADGDQQLFDKALADVQATRTKKQDAAQKIIDTQQARIEKSQDDQIKASRESAISDLFSQGITDPSTIQKYLNEAPGAGGKGDFTLGEITGALTSMVAKAPPGVADLVKTLQTNGAPSDVIQKVLGSANMNAAYAAAGDYANGGTGIIGEYNYYRAQAKQNGQVPVDFNTYQNEDANRKKSVAVTNNYNGTGAPGTLSKEGQAWVTAVQNGNSTMASVPAGLKNEVAIGLANTDTTSYSPLAASRFTTAANKMTSKYIDLPQYQLTANGLPYLQRIDAAMKTPGSVSDQDLLDSLTKLNTAGNAISDAQVKLITDGRSLSDAVSVAKNHLLNGGVLSGSQRQQIQSIAKAIFANYQKGYQPVYDKATKELQAAGIPEPFWGIPNLNQLTEEIDKGTGDKIVQDETAAQTAVVNAIKTKPELAPKVRELIGGTFKGVDHALTYSEAQQYLQATGEFPQE